MSDPEHNVGRLAMRQEGEDWVAYYATTDSMEGALRLGSVKMAVVLDGRRRRIFMDLMKEFVADKIEDIIGARPYMDDEHPAPEHERAGRA